MKLGMYVMVPGPISAAYIINHPHQCVCLYMYPLTVARQRLDKNVPAAANTYVEIEELLDASFSMGSVYHQRKVDY
jgi:hypothetical protein